MKLAVLKGLTIAAGVIALAGCNTFRSHKGAVIDPQLASAIQPGIDNKESVQKVLGNPSFTGEFAPNDWYYVSRDVNQVAFRNPHVTRQTVMLVRFDPKGNVSSIRHSGKELVLNVEPANRKTPTLGREKSFFEELFGNIGTVGAPGMNPQQ